MIGSWSAPCPDGTNSEELLLQFDQGRDRRVLIIPALFDEANKLRRFTVAVMRRMDEAGIDCLLPDLPGCNESSEPLVSQTLAGWRTAIEAAREQTGASHVLAIRGGAMLMPDTCEGWAYAPQSGPKQLRGMIRARTIAAREDGRAEKAEELLATGLVQGLVLAGWDLGPTLIADLQAHEIKLPETLQQIAQSDVGGGGLWLRAEPDHSPEQADALAAIIQTGLGAS